MEEIWHRSESTCGTHCISFNGLKDEPKIYHLCHGGFFFFRSLKEHFILSLLMNLQWPSVWDGRFPCGLKKWITLDITTLSSRFFTLVYVVWHWSALPECNISQRNTTKQQYSDPLYQNLCLTRGQWLTLKRKQKHWCVSSEKALSMTVNQYTINKCCLQGLYQFSWLTTLY